MAFEYYFAVDNDDDKGVPFGPVNKDNLDVVRLIIDFTSWLDANESVTELSFMAIKANPSLPLPPWQANYPLDETSKNIPVDAYPLVFVDWSVFHDGKAVIVDLAAGTPQLSYAVSFTATAGLSRRRRLVDILMVIDKPLNPEMVALGAPIPVYYYPLVIHGPTIFPADFKGRVYVDNITLLPITITLPLTPTMGDEVCFLDIAGNFDEYPVTFVGAPGSTALEGGITSITSGVANDDICFEWTGEYWNINRVAPIPVPLVIHGPTIFPAYFKGRVYVDNTTLLPITITLPLSPTMGDEVCFLDITGNFDEFPVTFVGAPGSTLFEDGGSSVSSNTPHEDICFEWTGEYWNINRVASGGAGAGECVNIMDFGAHMDGVTSDAPALTAAYNTAPERGTVCIPAGSINPGSFAPTSKFMLFKGNGTYDPSGTVPLIGLGIGTIETFIQNGTKYFGKFTKGAPNFGPTVRVDQTMNHVGGASGGNVALQANMSVAPDFDGNFVGIALAAEATDNRTSQSFPETIGLLTQAVRNHSGVGATIFGANPIVDDRSLAPSSQSGSAVGMEITVKANKLDDGLLEDGFNVNGAATGLVVGANRIGLDIKYTHSNLGDGSATDWSNFLNIGPSNPLEPNLSGRNFIRLTGVATYSGLNIRHLVVNTGRAIVMKSGQSVAWTPNASVELPDTWSYLSHEASGPARLRFVHVAPGSTSERFSISDAGQVAFTTPVHAVDDAAAAGAGVPIGGMYRNGSVLMVRVV